MECRSCGGPLIWDYSRGEVVCAKCGLVADVLTTFEAYEYRTPLLGSEEHQKPANMRRTRRGEVVSPQYRQILRLYRKCTKIIKNKPWLEVDYEKVFKTGKFVMSVKSRASLNAVRNISILGYWDTLKKGLEFIKSVNPAFLARSERSKYALAYIVARKIETGSYPTCEEVITVFNISGTSYKRLCVLADKLIASMGREAVVPCKAFRVAD